MQVEVRIIMDDGRSVVDSKEVHTLTSDNLSIAAAQLGYGLTETVYGLLPEED